MGLVHAVLDSGLVRAMAHPHSVDHYLELVSPRLSIGRIRAEVVEVLPEAPGVVTLMLRPNRNFRGYRAGQYVSMTVEVDGSLHTRCFSLSSSPLRADGLLSVTVKRFEGGLVSTFLVEHARPGASVVLSEPLGEFVLPEQLPGRLLFISGGSGITPCMSMLRTLLRGGYTGRIVFVHFARSRAEVIFADELRALARDHRNLTLEIRTDDEAGGQPRLSGASLATTAPDFDAWDAWVCGPKPLMDAVRALYVARGAGERLRTEQFVHAPTGGHTVGARDERGAVQFVRSRRRVAGDGRPLLEQAEVAGLEPKSGCRMGICQTCRCKKLSGVTRDTRTGELNRDDDTEIRLCVSTPVGDVALDL